MQLLEAAGLPAGVINLVLGDGPMVSEVALADPRLAGIHFTGSTATFQTLWREVGANIGNYHGYPRLVGETGGKDFVVAHSSADPDVLTTAMIRGAFDYQGQKCSAASRAFVPEVGLGEMGDDFVDKVAALRYGDVTDLVQLRRRGHRPARLRPQRGRHRPGQGDQQHRPSPPAAPTTTREGYFVQPTVLLGDDPTDEAFSTEYFGPILSVHVYDDAAPDAYADILRQVDAGSELRADRRGHRHRPGRGPAGDHGAALRRRQLLRQRQADRRRRRPAAVRRRPRLGHQRQGRLGAEPAALDVGPDHQGDLRARRRPPLPPPGPDDRPSASLLMSAIAVLSNPLRPALLAAARSPRLERTVTRLGLTRKLVDRFVPGRVRAGVVVGRRRALLASGRFVSVDYLGEDTTDAAQADATVAGLPVAAPGLRRR